jgi:glycosyltransferase involved in cell wall biosynthesis
MKFSIITPSLNQGRFIGEALYSVAQQSYSDMEHIVVDGNSDDGTVGLLQGLSTRPTYAHLRWLSEPDDGQSDALNKGLRLATGDIIGWLNSDDRYRPGCFEKVAQVFASDPHIDVLYGDTTWIDEAGRVFLRRREIEFSYFILLYHRVLYIPTTATFFRRRVIDKGHLLDTTLHYAMDFELFVRLAHAGYRFKHLPATLADFRWQRDSKSMIAAKRQREEQDRIARQRSAIFHKVPGRHLREWTFLSLRQAAGVRRYTEKLLRGYYIDYLHSVSSRR